MRRIPKYNSEHNLYEQIARYLQLQYPDVIYRFDIAADLKLTMGQAVKHKRLHPERGYPDLFIAKTKEIKVKTVLGSGYSLVEIKPLGGLYIEIKKDGEKLTKKDGSWRTPHIAEQAEALEKLRARGYKAEFGVGFSECKQIIDEYLRYL
nr:MAG TPA: Nuclease [Caudoviricetes sp.]